MDNFGFLTSKDTIKSAEKAADNSSSEIHVQVDGVDEADIIKNDGKYIYTVRNENDKILIYEADGKAVEPKDIFIVELNTSKLTTAV